MISSLANLFDFKRKQVQSACPHVRGTDCEIKRKPSKDGCAAYAVWARFYKLADYNGHQIGGRFVCYG